MIKMLNELRNRDMRKIRRKMVKKDQKWSKNRKVRVRDIKIFEEIMKRCRKKSSTIGKEIWGVENSGKGRVFFDIVGEDNVRNAEKGGLIKKELKN